MKIEELTQLEILLQRYIAWYEISEYERLNKNISWLLNSIKSKVNNELWLFK